MVIVCVYEFIPSEESINDEPVKTLCMIILEVVTGTNLGRIIGCSTRTIHAYQAEWLFGLSARKRLRLSQSMVEGIFASTLYISAGWPSKHRTRSSSPPDIPRLLKHVTGRRNETSYLIDDGKAMESEQSDRLSALQELDSLARSKSGSS